MKVQVLIPAYVGAGFCNDDITASILLQGYLELGSVLSLQSTLNTFLVSQYLAGASRCMASSTQNTSRSSVIALLRIQQSIACMGRLARSLSPQTSGQHLLILACLLSPARTFSQSFTAFRRRSCELEEGPQQAPHQMAGCEEDFQRLEIILKDAEELVKKPSATENTGRSDWLCSLQCLCDHELGMIPTLPKQEAS